MLWQTLPFLLLEMGLGITLAKQSATVSPSPQPFPLLYITIISVFSCGMLVVPWASPDTQPSSAISVSPDHIQEDPQWHPFS